MNLIKTHQLLQWLKANKEDQMFSLKDMEELLSIATTELDDQNDKSFEALPGTTVNSIIESMKESGEYYRLNKKINAFKSRFFNK